MVYDPTKVFNEFDRGNHHLGLKRAEGEYVFGIDENEADSILRDQISGIGAVVMRDGQVIEGAGITLDADTGECSLGAGRVGAFGLIRYPEAAELTVPTVGELTVGLWIETRIVTGGVFDKPGFGFDGVGHDRPAREQQLPRWGLSTETNPDTASVTYAYVAVYRIKDGVVVEEARTDGPWMSDLERYDREAHGSYSVTGMDVSALGKVGSEQLFSVSAGTVNAYGRKISRAADQRHAETEAPPLRAIQGEKRTYVNAGGSSVLTLRNGPIASIQRVELLKQKTAAITKGLVNTSDALPDGSVSAIVSVTQGGTTYVATTDYVLSDDKVSWAPGGAEPTPGSTYNVTYRYYAVVTPTATTADTITVADGVDGSEVTIDYTYKVRRIDALAISASGDLVYVPGPVNHLAPRAPDVAGELLLLAHIDNDWRATPKVTQKAPLAMTVAVHRDQAAAFADLQAQVSRIALAQTLGSVVSSTRDNQFVDSFVDDSQRDAGATQTLAVQGGVLRLPSTVTVHDLPLTGPTLPPRTTARIRTREIQDGTVSLQVATRPARMVIAKRPDPRLVEASAMAADTLLVSRPVARPGGGVTANRGFTGRWREQQHVATVSGLTAGATLTSFNFNYVSLAVDSSTAADAGGVATVTFTVPAGTPLGGKVIRTDWSDGAHSEYVWGSYSTTRPGGQNGALNFALPALGAWLGKAQFRLAAVSGSAPIYWQVALRDDSAYPLRGGYRVADGLVDMTGKAAGDWIEIDFGALDAVARPLIIILSSAGAHTLHTCPADDTLISQNWQASSRTLTHRLDAAVFVNGRYTVPLATIAVSGATDLSIQGDYHRNLYGNGTQVAYNSITYELTVAGVKYQIPETDGVVPLPAAYTGDVEIAAILQVGRYLTPLPAPIIEIASERIQLLVGHIESTGSSVGLVMPAMSNKSITAFATARIDPGASAVIEVETAPGTWQALTLSSQTPLGGGWYDIRWTRASTTASVPRLRTTLTGGVEAQVYLDDLRGAIH